MDEIYSNLENYNEDATLAELQNENRDLKMKLQDYAARMEKLQRNILQDFDTLSSEHKKLELNFSSLLKTARAEIERKTMTISLLNLEKDKLVLNSVQNRNSRNLLNPKSYAPIKRNDDDLKHNKRNNNMETNSTETDRGSSIFSPKDDFFKSGTDSSTKENISRKINIVETKPRTIKNRRKSMPSFGVPAVKFSSDEEENPNSVKILPPREKGYNLDRNVKSNRTSDVLDDRNVPYMFDSYDHQRDAYRNRLYRHPDMDKFRNQERSDSSQKYRREISPGRNRRRNRESHEDHQRMDLERFRHDGSSEKFHQYQRRLRPNYDRIQEQDRYKTRSQDRYSNKHKIPEYDKPEYEPKHKRMKPDLFHRQYDKEKWNSEMQQMSEEFDKQYASCQSPDIDFPETNVNFPVKEIKLTANTQLDDPRKSSERYIVKEKNGRETMMAVGGINVDIPLLAVDKSSYDIQPIKMPEALKKMPLIADELVTEIYDNIEHPLLNTLESGELVHNSQIIVQEPKSKFTSKNETNIAKDANSDHIQKTNSNNEEVLAKSESIGSKPKSSYKIPKVKTNCSTSISSKNNDVALSANTHDNNKVNYKLRNKNNAVPANNVEDITSDENKYVPTIENDTNSRDVNVKDKAPAPQPPQLPFLSNPFEDSTRESIRTKASIKMVEDDLELSDETCDTDIYKQKEKPAKKCSDSVRLDKKHVTKVVEPIKPDKNISESKNDDNEVSDNDKKTKTRKKQNKQKNSSEEIKTKDIQSSETFGEKKVKEVKTKEIKTKFSELFGDSSSLISPEDLGLVSVKAPPDPLSTTYVPMFEDAQDGIDLNNKQFSSLPELAPNNLDKISENIMLDNLKNNVKSLEITKKTDMVTNQTPATISNETPIQCLYRNLELEPKSEDNVKTVIISSGMQPAVAFNKPSIKTLDNIHPKPPDQADIKALATSTPLKDLSIVNTKILETNKRNNIISENTENSSMDISDSNTYIVSNNADVPDVRIFVKRRRKLIKK